MAVELSLHVRGDPQLELEADATGNGGTGDYSRLVNKPSINSVELDGDRSFDDLGLFEQVYSKDGLMAEFKDDMEAEVRTSAGEQVGLLLETCELTTEELEELLKG